MAHMLTLSDPYARARAEATAAVAHLDAPTRNKIMSAIAAEKGAGKSGTELVQAVLIATGCGPYVVDYCIEAYDANPAAYQQQAMPPQPAYVIHHPVDDGMDRPADEAVRRRRPPAAIPAPELHPQPALPRSAQRSPHHSAGLHEQFVRLSMGPDLGGPGHLDLPHPPGYGGPQFTPPMEGDGFAWASAVHDPSPPASPRASFRQPWASASARDTDGDYAEHDASPAAPAASLHDHDTLDTIRQLHADGFSVIDIAGVLPGVDLFELRRFLATLPPPSAHDTQHSPANTRSDSRRRPASAYPAPGPLARSVAESQPHAAYDARDSWRAPAPDTDDAQEMSYLRAEGQSAPQDRKKGISVAKIVRGGFRAAKEFLTPRRMPDLGSYPPAVVAAQPASRGDAFANPLYAAEAVQPMRPAPGQSGAAQDDHTIGIPEDVWQQIEKCKGTQGVTDMAIENYLVMKHGYDRGDAVRWIAAYNRIVRSQPEPYAERAPVEPPRGRPMASAARSDAVSSIDDETRRLVLELHREGLSTTDIATMIERDEHAVHGIIEASQPRRASGGDRQQHPYASRASFASARAEAESPLSPGMQRSEEIVALYLQNARNPDILRILEGRYPDMDIHTVLDLAGVFESN